MRIPKITRRIIILLLHVLNGFLLVRTPEVLRDTVEECQDVKDSGEHPKVFRLHLQKMTIRQNALMSVSEQYKNRKHHSGHRSVHEIGLKRDWDVQKVEEASGIDDNVGEEDDRDHGSVEKETVAEDPGKDCDSGLLKVRGYPTISDESAATPSAETSSLKLRLQYTRTQIQSREAPEEYMNEEKFRRRYGQRVWNFRILQVNRSLFVARTHTSSVYYIRVIRQKTRRDKG